MKNNEFMFYGKEIAMDILLASHSFTGRAGHSVPTVVLFLFVTQRREVVFPGILSFKCDACSQSNDGMHSSQQRVRFPSGIQPLVFDKAYYSLRFCNYFIRTCRLMFFN